MSKNSFFSRFSFLGLGMIKDRIDLKGMSYEAEEPSLQTFYFLPYSLLKKAWKNGKHQVRNGHKCLENPSKDRMFNKTINIVACHRCFSMKSDKTDKAEGKLTKVLTPCRPPPPPPPAPPTPGCTKCLPISRL